MFDNGERDEARDQAVGETLDLIDRLDVDQARSLLRCFAIDEENFDSRALETVTKTVRDTCHRSGSDYDALCHFPSGAVARLNREYLLEALAASAEADMIAQQAAEKAQRTDKSTQTAGISQRTDHSTQTAGNDHRRQQSTQTSENFAKVQTSTTNGHYEQQMDGAVDPLTADLGDLEFEKQETRRLIREGHVTINHYYMSKAPELKPEQVPKQEPVQEPFQEPVQKQEKKPRNTTFVQAQSLMCARCNKWYFEKDNVLREDDRGPCRIHTGQVVYYGETREEAWEEYGSPVAGYAWNCCRRRRRMGGCNPAFHTPV